MAVAALLAAETFAGPQVVLGGRGLVPFGALVAGCDVSVWQTGEQQPVAAAGRRGVRRREGKGEEEPLRQETQRIPATLLRTEMKKKM